MKWLSATKIQLGANNDHRALGLVERLKQIIKQRSTGIENVAQNELNSNISITSYFSQVWSRKKINTSTIEAHFKRKTNPILSIINIELNTKRLTIKMLSIGISIW